MNQEEALSLMVSPGQQRPKVWLGGVMQIHITRACDKACFHCTQGSNLGGKPVLMPVEEFEKACQSLTGYFGVVGVFGGNPALHPQFPEICAILTKYFPKHQRGLWCNHPKGHGKLMRETFDPDHSNLNVHLDQEAFIEFKRTWPESKPFGEKDDSHHSSPWVSMRDVEPDESKRWDMIADCDINKQWSAMLCYVPNRGLRAYFCEIAGAQAMLHAHDPNWPDTGTIPFPGWWCQPMSYFVEQVKLHCHRCGVPLRRKEQLAINGEHEEVSADHIDIYKTKERGRQVELVTIDTPVTGHVKHVTDYMQAGKVTGGVQ